MDSHDNRGNLRGEDLMRAEREKRIQNMKAKRAAEEERERLEQEKAAAKKARTMKTDDFAASLEGDLCADRAADEEQAMAALSAHRQDQAGPSYAAHHQPGRGGQGFKRLGDDAGRGVPDGWLRCPPCGDPVHIFIPCKVPLGESWSSKVPEEFRFTPAQVYHQQLHQKRQIGLVIDLTNSSRYYRPQEWLDLNVHYIKIACLGRDGPPDPNAVNEFVFRAKQYEMQVASAQQPKRYILVHCTHGHNRTGAMLVHYMVRYNNFNVPQALREYAAKRPPGIYKEGYISSLYKYYHWHWATDLPPCPGTPEWKQDSEPNTGGGEFHAPEGDLFGDENSEYCSTPLVSPVELPVMPQDNRPPDFYNWPGPKAGCCVGLPEPELRAPGGEEELGGAEAREGEITHEDLIGEAMVVQEQVVELRKLVHVLVTGAEPSNFRRLASFPGSQPVSLDSRNMDLLRDRDYRVTWKADGTRYMLLVTMDGAYLIDRKFDFRRVQMCFPFSMDRTNGDVKFHKNTLMDGEMVVDVDISTGIATRRYLVYDLMAINSTSLQHTPFTQRYEYIARYVIKPRKELECLMSSTTRPPKYKYLFSSEPFRVRRKDFWELQYCRKVLGEFTEALCHESDGLIFQPAKEDYTPFTCQGLLKWKPAHMNSVDFFCEALPGQEPRLAVGGSHSGGRREGGAGPLEFLTADKGRLELPPGVPPTHFHGRIIECAWDKQMKCWTFMRERTDKDTPNHITTYNKVLESISDNITEEKLLTHVEGTILHTKNYART